MDCRPEVEEEASFSPFLLALPPPPADHLIGLAGHDMEHNKENTDPQLPSPPIVLVLKVESVPSAKSPAPVTSAPEQRRYRSTAVADLVQDSALDIHGRPASRSRTGNWKACILIFGCEVCERVAFYAISSNLAIYLTRELHEGIAESARNVNNWTGTTFLTPLLGAFLADALLGRYWTLAIFLVGYLLSLVFVTVAVSLPTLRPAPCRHLPDGSLFCPPASGPQIAFFYFALYLMALGAGGIKSNVSSFAGDQFDELHPVESRRKTSFLNWWFMSISFGTMISVSVLVYVEENFGWSWGYGAAAVATAAAAVLFFAGTSYYRHRLPSGSPLTRVAQVIVAATRKWKAPLQSGGGAGRRLLLYEAVGDMMSDGAEQDDLSANSSYKRLPHTDDFAFLDRAAMILPNEESAAAAGSAAGNINPWELCPVTQVEEVKLLIRMLPIWVTNLVFSAVFAQVGTLFLNQGATMERHLGRSSFEIPAACFPLFITLTICLLLPIYDRWLVPAVRRLSGEERGLSILQRIGVGQVISTLSIAAAALVEQRRLQMASQSGLLDNPSATVPMSIFWLLPQYLLTGLCEVFISVGQLEFFYDQAPDSMRSVGAALYLSTIAVGSFISGLLVTVVCRLTAVTDDGDGGWIGNNLNRSHLDYFYWLLALISAANCLLYVMCAKRYTYKTIHRHGADTVATAAAVTDPAAAVALAAPPAAGGDSDEESGVGGNVLLACNCVVSSPAPLTASARANDAATEELLPSAVVSGDTT